MRRALAALASPLLALALVACGAGADPEEADDSPIAEEAVEASDGGAESTPTEETAAADDEDADGETPSDDDATTTDGTEEGTDAGTATSEEPEETETPRHTSIETTWVDDTWTIEEVDEDLCAMGLSESTYSEQEDMVTCGPTAVGAEACAIESGEEMLCIVEPVEKKAIRFTSPSAADPSAEVWPTDETPIPLFVELTDGAVCSTISHDHDQHWNGRFSWYRCEDGSELLTVESIGDTFARGDVWQVERSVDQGEPETTDVATATFAGR
jgi:hypothetical protein